MNVFPSVVQEGLRQVELMTSVPLCRALKELCTALIEKKSGLVRVLSLHICVSIILFVKIQKVSFVSFHSKIDILVHFVGAL